MDGTWTFIQVPQFLLLFFLLVLLNPCVLSDLVWNSWLNLIHPCTPCELPLLVVLFILKKRKKIFWKQWEIITGLTMSLSFLLHTEKSENMLLLFKETFLPHLIFNNDFRWCNLLLPGCFSHFKLLFLVGIKPLKLDVPPWRTFLDYLTKCFKVRLKTFTIYHLACKHPLLN